MRYLDIENQVAAILGLLIFGVGLHAKLGVYGIVGVFVFMLFPLSTRWLFAHRRDMARFSFNLILLALLCGSTWLALCKMGWVH